MTTQTLRLRRLPRDSEGQSRYLHPNGYVIVAGRRSWDERVGMMRGASLAGPLTWWDVFEHVGSYGVGHFRPWAHRDRPCRAFDTLRDARRWCDEHPRERWHGDA